jgi:hypothetical protein
MKQYQQTIFLWAKLSWIIKEKSFTTKRIHKINFISFYPKERKINVDQAHIDFI